MLLFKIEEKCLEAQWGGFSCFLGKTGRGFVSNKAVPKILNTKYRLEFKHGFSNSGCLRCAIQKAFKEKRVHKARDMQFFLHSAQNEILKLLKMFKSNMKFTRAACWINSKVSNVLIIFLFYHYCWSFLCCKVNIEMVYGVYWRSLLLWNSFSWSCLKLAVQMQLALYLCDSFTINNRNMIGSSVEK